MLSPTLVIELVSPGTDNQNRDYLEKRREYALRGIPEYWIIDPSRAVMLVLALDGQDYREVGQFREQERIISPTFPTLNLTAAQVLSAKQ